MKIGKIKFKTISLMLAFLLLQTFLFSSTSWGEALSELRLYKRCYNHLTSSPISLADANVAKIRAGSLTAVEACDNILAQAMLKSDGTPVGGVTDETKKTMKTMTSMHKSYFQAQTIEQIPDYDEGLNRGTQDVYDPAEPAETLSYNLFKDDPYKNVLLYQTGIRAIRREDKAVTAKIGYQISVPSRRFNFDVSTFGYLDVVHFRAKSVPDANGVLVPSGFETNSDLHSPADFSRIPMLNVGEIVGFRPTTESMIVKNEELGPLPATRPGDIEPSLEYQFDFFRTFGGGVLGQPIFYLLNYGHNLGTKFNGTLKLPRRWSKSAYESFLCLSFPNLREKDIVQFVVPTSSAPFRTQRSCVACHATLDQAAVTARNLVTGSTDYVDLTLGAFRFSKFPMIVAKYNVTKPIQYVWSAEPQTDFNLQEPKGKIYYRSYTGELVEKAITGIQDFGQKLTETDDYYACAAKRYFEYFTGKSVPLYDRTDPRNAELNRNLNMSQIRDRKVIEQLGKNLKSHQSLRKLVGEIIRTDIYRDENYEPQ